MRNTYFYRVYRHNRKLFCFVLAFAVTTLACNLAGDQVTPFFVWGMYSQPEPAVSRYDVLRTEANGRLFDPSSGYLDNTRFYLNAPLATYKSMLDKGGEDPSRMFLARKLEAGAAGDGGRVLAGSEGWRAGVLRLGDRVFNGRDELAAFPDWYTRYVSSVRGGPARRLTVSVARVHFDEDQHIAVDSTYPLYPWSHQ